MPYGISHPYLNWKVHLNLRVVGQQVLILFKILKVDSVRKYRAA